MKEPNYFIDAIKDTLKQALDETAEVFKNSKGKYIVVTERDDSFEVESDRLQYAVWGVGLNDAGHICISGYLIGGIFDEDDLRDLKWVDVAEIDIKESYYPELYRFVAENIEKATSLEEALESEFFKKYF